MLYRKRLEICYIISLSILLIGIRIKFKNVLPNLSSVKIKEDSIIPRTFQKVRIPSPLMSVVPTQDDAIPEAEKYVELLSRIEPRKIPDPGLVFEYIAHQVPPAIVGGSEAIKEFLYYPQWLLEKEIEGQVIIGILINSRGKIERLELLKGCNVFFEEMCIRAIQAVEWTPAYQRHLAVKCWVAVPFRFEIK